MQLLGAFFEEALGLTHKAATGLVAALALGGNVFVLWFSEGLTALGTIDFWVGTFLIFIVAMVQIICFAWIFGVDKGLALAHDGASIRIPAVLVGDELISDFAVSGNRLVASYRLSGETLHFRITMSTEASQGKMAP